MRGSDRRSGELFSYVDGETRVRSDHPLRVIRSIVNETLDALMGSSTRSTWPGAGRPSAVMRRSRHGAATAPISEVSAPAAPPRSILTHLNTSVGSISRLGCL